ncbi:MAG: alpha-glucosidase [Pisciglobus halotolerans]|nr:alpha-glucosidase [Pisciglobus halotolerans]
MKLKNGEWWKNAVGYQIYVPSFADSNQDGVGDLNGVREKLDYLVDLGIDFIWLSPVYESPNVDSGYDISNYYKILPEFGTMDDFDQLLKEAHDKNLRIIMDLVINHTSNQHPWFLESKKNKTNPYRNYYIWQPPRKEGGLPSNWESIFGGSVWEWDVETKEYYMHIFAKEQPDLNWENPVMRQDLYRMIRWWLEKGIDGFRIDAITHIKKQDLHDVSKELADMYMNEEGLGDCLLELKAVFNEYPTILTIGEASGIPASEAEKWAGENGYFNMIFSFDHIHVWASHPDEQPDIREMKTAFDRWQQALANDGWNALFLENHDIPRSVSMFGDQKKYWKRSAKALATLFLLLRGTPFIYQGQELGMTNMHFHSIDELKAVDSKRKYSIRLAKGEAPKEAFEELVEVARDNARTPMQWTDGVYAGFSDVLPWMGVNRNKDLINAAAEQQDPDSVWNHYRTLIALRKEEPGLLVGTFKLHNKTHKKIIVYERKSKEADFLILVNLTKERASIHLPTTVSEKKWTRCLTNCHSDLEDLRGELVLKSFEATIYKRERS